MGVDIKEAFPDEGNAVCSTFFTSVDLSEKLWAGIERLATADDVTFWTVVAHHDRLPVVLLNLVTAVDYAHSSHAKAHRRAVTAEGEQNVVQIIVRLATLTEPCARRGVDVARLASRIGVLLPWKLLFPAALMLLRHSGSAASVTITALILLNPGYLCTLPAYMPLWSDAVSRFAVRCAHDLQRGRYQRLPGDILSTFEQVYRLTKQLWAVLQCAPFLADYLSLQRTLWCLRIIVDVLSPILQHFVMVCDELSTRRAILSRANSVILNAAISATSVLLLYRTYVTQGGVKQQQHLLCLPQVVNRTYRVLREHLQQYAQGYQLYVLQVSQKQSLADLIHHLYPPIRSSEDATERALGPSLLTLTEEMADSNDFADAARGTRQRYFELVLLEVVRQGVHIDQLLARHLVTPSEAGKLGASEDAIHHALAGMPATDAVMSSSAGIVSPPPPGSAAPVASAAAVMDDPLVAMVADVFPQYAPAGIRAALNFYSNDVEQFIMDASMENLPPHLVGPLTANGPSDAELAAALALEDLQSTGASPVPAADGGSVGAGGSGHPGNNTHLELNDFDDAFNPETLYRLLGRDLYELVTDSDTDDRLSAHSAGGGEEEDEINYKITLNDPRTYMSDAFDVDEEMKAKIRMLNEIMYEDELDDAQQDVHLAGGDIIDDASDDEGLGGRQGRQGRGGPAAVTNPSSSAQPNAATAPARAPRDEYHDKRYHEKRSKDRLARTKEIQSERAERVPAYANKKKTSKAKASGTKSSLQRAVKKGKYDPDA